MPWLRRLVVCLLTAETRTCCGINCGQSGTGSEFSPSTYTFRCQYYYTNATYSSYSLILLSPQEQTDETFKQSNAFDRKVLSYYFSAFKNTLRGYFESLKAHMEMCVASNGNSVEGVNVEAVIH